MPKFLAVYMGTPPANAAGGPPAMDPDQMQKGMAAWHKWMDDHASAVVDAGGPLGKTKRAAPDGISDTKNALTGYVILEAPTHDAAAQLFLNHPHFTIFPGDSVEILQILPMPGG